MTDISHEFELIVDRDPTDDATVDALFDVAEGGLHPAGNSDDPYVRVYSRDLGSLASAVRDAVLAVESVGLKVTGVRSTGFDSVRDIAERTGYPVGHLRQLIAESADFPEPVADDDLRYPRDEVDVWFAANLPDVVLTDTARDVELATENDRLHNA